MKRPFRKGRLARWLSGKITGTDELLGLREDDRSELLFEAKRLLDAGKIADAEKLYRLARACFPAIAEPWIGLGACEQLVGKISAAMVYYESALERRSGDPYVLANLAECGLLIGDVTLAKTSLDRIGGEARSKLPADLAKRVDALEVIATKATTESDDPVVSAEITYQREAELSEAEFRSVLERSTLAERRPMEVSDALRKMLANANLIVTARAGKTLVGVSRALSDFAFCTYLSDLAVDCKFQKQGIGRELIRRTHEEAGLVTTLILLAAPAARDYYPHIGMTAHDSCWIIPRSPSSSATGM